MAQSISQQLRDVLQKVEESEHELQEGRSQIRRLTGELQETRQLLEFWKGQATKNDVDAVPRLIHDECGGRTLDSKASLTEISAYSNRTDVCELHDSIDELSCLPGDLPKILVMMDNILKCRKYYQCLWLDATCEITQRFGHWTKLRLHAKKQKGDPALAWYNGQGWVPTTKEDLKMLASVLVELQEEFEALCEFEQLSPYPV